MSVLMNVQSNNIVENMLELLQEGLLIPLLTLGAFGVGIIIIVKTVIDVSRQIGSQGRANVDMKMAVAGYFIGGALVVSGAVGGLDWIIKSQNMLSTTAINIATNDGSGPEGNAGGLNGGGAWDKPPEVRNVNPDDYRHGNQENRNIKEAEERAATANAEVARLQKIYDDAKKQADDARRAVPNTMQENTERGVASSLQTFLDDARKQYAEALLKIESDPALVLEEQFTRVLQDELKLQSRLDVDLREFNRSGAMHIERYIELLQETVDRHNDKANIFQKAREDAESKAVALETARDKALDDLNRAKGIHAASLESRAATLLRSANSRVTQLQTMNVSVTRVVDNFETAKKAYEVVKEAEKNAQVCAEEMAVEHSSDYIRAKLKYDETLAALKSAETVLNSAISANTSAWKAFADAGGVKPADSNRDKTEKEAADLLTKIKSLIRNS